VATSVSISTFQGHQFLSLVDGHHLHIAGRALKAPQCLGLKLSHDRGLIPMKTKIFFIGLKTSQGIKTPCQILKSRMVMKASLLQ